MELKFKKGEILTYDYLISGQEQVIIQDPDSQTPRITENNFNDKYILTLRGLSSDKGEISIVKSLGKDENLPVDDMPPAVTDKKGNLIEPQGSLFEEFLPLNFNLPGEKVQAGGQWRQDLAVLAWSRGILNSTLLGRENYNGQDCMKIETDFHLLKEDCKDFFRHEGRGVSYFLLEEGCFFEINRDFQLKSSVVLEGGKKADLQQTGKILIRLRK